MQGDTRHIHSRWIEEAKMGDEQSQYELYRAYAQTMFNTLVRMVKHHEEAEDLLQETFCKAFLKLNTFSGQSSFGTWLKRITINTALEHLRKRKIDFEEMGQEVIERTKEEEMEEIVDMELVNHAIKELPQGGRIILNLFLLEGYSHKEIAEQLGISESTSKTQYKRAKDQLKVKLKSVIYG